MSWHPFFQPPCIHVRGILDVSNQVCCSQSRHTATTQNIAEAVYIYHATVWLPPAILCCYIENAMPKRKCGKQTKQGNKTAYDHIVTVAFAGHRLRQKVQEYIHGCTERKRKRKREALKDTSLWYAAFSQVNCVTSLSYLLRGLVGSRLSILVLSLKKMKLRTSPNQLRDHLKLHLSRIKAVALSRRLSSYTCACPKS